jgi:hypothetical protein
VLLKANIFCAQIPLPFTTYEEQMPIYEYQTERGTTIERIYRYQDRPDSITLDDGTVAKLKMSLPARTAGAWADAAGTRYGVNGKYNKALGRVVHSDKEADAIAAEKGYVRMPSDFKVEDALERSGAKLND